MRRAGREREWAILALITLGAAVLRLVHIGKVTPDPFYDAAVRSMGLSWHNFFFGAFEPGASVSIDKPPVDLWLQVVSVKLLGFSSTTLKLPEAFAGIVSVPLLYSAVRRMWNGVAGLAAALALAVLPVEVVTSRSDTMDGVMMALIVLALLLIVKAIETGRDRWIFAAAVTLGISFDVKLLESIVALPGLALIAYLGLGASRRRRLGKLALAGAVYVAVALAWLTATLIAPASDRPWAIGSTDGSAWNAAFVFNGTDRLGAKTQETGVTVYEPGHQYPVATQSERDHIPIVPPSPTRLLARIGPLSGQRLGLELLIGLLLGIPAFLWGVRETRRESQAGPDGVREVHEPEPPGPSRRLRIASAAGLSLWTLTGIVLFSHMVRLHPRYVEGFVPAVAAMLGIGLAWAAQARERLARVALVVALAVTVYYDERLLYGRPAIWWVSLAAALAAIALALVVELTRTRRTGDAADKLGLASTAMLACSLVAVLALPLKASLVSIHDNVSDAGLVGALPNSEQQVLSSYLLSHGRGARYEVAAESATGIGSLIVKDARPIVVLTTYDGRVYTHVAKLQRLIAAGQVRYAFLSSYCGHPSPINAACSEPVRWVRAHGTDVSREAGLSRGKVLYLLPGARP